MENQQLPSAELNASGEPAMVTQPLVAPSRARTSTRVLPAILLAALVAGVGAILGLISLVEPVPKPYLVPIWVSQSINDSAGIHGPVLNEFHAITAKRMFANVDPTAIANPTNSLMLDQLESLKSRSSDESVVVYISAYAAIDEQGDLFLVSQDAGSSNPANRLYLKKILAVLKQSKSKQKLLALDISWPFVIPEFEMFDDNIASHVEKCLLVNADPNLLCINSCSPGQNAWTMLAPRRSTFGFFFEQGMLGAADGFSSDVCDGRVTVSELAGYLAARVDDYSSRVCPSRQTPMLLGAGDDFPLVAYSSNPQQGQATDLASSQPLPGWLTAAWEARDKLLAAGTWNVSPGFVRDFENTILQYEMNWRRGADPVQASANLESDLKLLASEFNRAIKILDAGADLTPNQNVDVPGLAAIAKAAFQKRENAEAEKVVAGSADGQQEAAAAKKETGSAATPPSDQAKAEQAKTAAPTVAPRSMPTMLSSLFADLTDKKKITPAANWPAVEAKLIGKFEEATKQVGDEDFIDNLFQFAAKAPGLRSSQISTLSLLQGKRGLVSVKSNILAELARRLTATEPTSEDRVRNIHQIQQTLDLIASSETGFSEIETWDWLGELKSAADEERYVVESIFWRPGYVSGTEFDSRLQSAIADFESLSGLSRQVGGCYRTMDSAEWRLPQLARFGDLYSKSLGLPRVDRWKRAADFTGKLQRICTEVTSGIESNELSKQLKLASIDAIELDSQLQNLMWRYQPSAVSSLVIQAQSESTCSECLKHLQHYLDTPFVDCETRIQIHDAALSLSYKHHLLALDAYEGPVQSEILSLSKEDLLRASERSQARTAKRKIVYAELNKILNRPNRAELSGWPRFNVNALKLELASVRNYWSHLAANYQKLAAESPLAATYEGLAQRYRELSSSSPRQSLSVDVVSVDKELSPVQRQSEHAVAVYREAQTSQSGTRKFSNTSHVQGKRELKSDGNKLQVNVLPTSSRAIEVDTTLKANQRKLVFDIRLDNQAKQVDFIDAKGFFVEFVEDNHRFLHRVDLPGLSKEKPIELFFGTSSNSLVAADSSIRLRPSKERQPTSLFVKNLTNSQRELEVKVNEYTGKLKLKPNQTKRVTLAGKPPKPEEPLPRILTGLAVEVVDSKSEAVLLTEKIDVVVATPREYVEVLSSQFTPFAGGRNRLEVTLRASKKIVGPPCTVALVLDPAKIPGLHDVEGGKLHSTLPRDGSVLKLYAENLRLEEMETELGQFEISVDGEPRTFVFDATFARQGTPTTPKLVSAPGIGLAVASVGLAGPDFPIGLQTINAPVGSRLELQFGRQDAPLVPDRKVSLANSRQTQIGFSPDGSGNLLFSAKIDDWKTKLDTSGLIGTRQIKVQMMLNDSVVARSSRTISLDNRPPTRVRFENLSQRVAVGSNHVVKVEAVSETTGIRSVELFLGKLENGKLPEKVELLACSAVGSDRQTRGGNGKNPSWASSIKIPMEIGTAHITAVATNGAGLKTFETQPFEVVAAEDLDFGKIKGRVFESVRAQPGLEVVLQDPQGNVLAKTKTSTFGDFVFPAVRSGNYIVVSNKSANGRSGGIRVKVAAGQTSGGDVSLELR